MAVVVSSPGDATTRVTWVYLVAERTGSPATIAGGPPARTGEPTGRA
jgi:hypothetical protein